MKVEKSVKYRVTTKFTYAPMGFVEMQQRARECSRRHRSALHGVPYALSANRFYPFQHGDELV